MANPFDKDVANPWQATFYRSRPDRFHVRFAEDLANSGKMQCSGDVRREQCAEGDAARWENCAPEMSVSLSDSCNIGQIV
ncbi:MAG TPA: hypothetical protein VFE62_03320 [Gemmataceae bacterium]|nr:hypothetical protein [Gemmataceae bacterium]